MDKVVTFEIPPGTAAKACLGCSAPVFWIVTKNQKRMPVNQDGVSHFATCPHSQQFRRSR